MSKNIYLIRHGSTGNQYKNHFIGQTDIPLSEDGQKQAAKLSSFIAQFKLKSCFSSPLKRAHDTAKIAMNSDCGTIIIDKNLREINFGRWEGMTFDEIQGTDPELVAKWSEFRPEFEFPGGESLQDFERRMVTVWSNLCLLDSKEILVFTHGGVIRCLICLFQGLPLKEYLSFGIEPASITTISLVNGKAELIELNNLSFI